MDILTIILLIIAVSFVLSVLLIGSKVYYDKIAAPKNRRRKLEVSLARAASFNIHNSESDQISIVELLDAKSDLNRIAKIAQGAEVYHEGPYDYELSDDEWSFVHQRYPELVENISGHKMKVEAHKRLLGENEERIHKLTSMYHKEAQRIGSDKEEEWNKMFSKGSENNGITEAEASSAESDTVSSPSSQKEEPETVGGSFTWNPERRERMDAQVLEFLKKKEKMLEDEKKDKKVK